MNQKILSIAVAIIFAGCAHVAPSGPVAVAKLEPTIGNTAAGTVTFTQVGDKVRVEATLTGLKPNADHGFHIHEKGDCSSGDGMSTGGHFNPLGKPHGAHAAMERHAGDLPSLKADAAGGAKLSVVLDVITVSAGPASIVGRGMIAHRDPDDYTTQPTGNAGPRIACAVIQAN